MKCPKCNSDNFYVGIISGGECENVNCELRPKNQKIAMKKLTAKWTVESAEEFINRNNAIKLAKDIDLEILDNLNQWFNCHYIPLKIREEKPLEQLSFDFVDFKVRLY